MKVALVKIDVAATLTGKAIATLFDMADGAALIDGSLSFVFDFSNGQKEARRDLRFWMPELEALARGLRLNDDIDEVISHILPAARENFHAGEVDCLFQIRHNTRRELLDSAGLNAGRNFYSRDTLAAFLKRRWINSAKTFSVQPTTRPLTDKTGAIAGPDKGIVPVASRLNRI